MKLQSFESFLAPSYVKQTLGLRVDGIKYGIAAEPTIENELLGYNGPESEQKKVGR